MRTAELVDQTDRFLDLLEAGNRAGMADMLDDQVVWSAPMSFSGAAEDSEPARGREAFGSRLGSISELMRSARFIDRRITASTDASTTFVQARGDFVTVAGRPYQNVYVFRFDWRDGKIVSWEEYANPITIIRTFPQQYGHLIEALLSKD
ncbi:MAG TPA: nuclear transport factor 2 family protein [Streptosporangiaceae bacterium]|nr:nuclear transport factor 2 family protein [Streptosporangiaceae bacterium]